MKHTSYRKEKLKSLTEEEFNESVGNKRLSLCFGGRMRKVEYRGMVDIVPSEYSMYWNAIAPVGGRLVTEEDNTLTLGGECLSKNANSCEVFQLRESENEFMCLDWTNGHFVLMSVA